MSVDQHIENLLKASQKFRDAGKGAAEAIATLEKIDFFHFDLETWSHWRETAITVMKHVIDGSENMLDETTRLIDDLQRESN